MRKSEWADVVGSYGWTDGVWDLVLLYCEESLWDCLDGFTLFQASMLRLATVQIGHIYTREELGL